LKKISGIKFITIDINALNRYNSQDITIEQIKAAAENANALAFIERNQFGNHNHIYSKSYFYLECADIDNDDYGSGFQRKVGPKGSQLSGGQKQRIAIARAIIRNPAIYLFDEPTSALDSQNEESIQESLERLMERSTSITIAHRMSTVKNCEKIFVFLEGRIVESGDYRSLVEKQGVFYKLEKGLPLNEK
jgi:ATP-binding cassette subfamily B (MDR/TAP) protein 1